MIAADRLAHASRWRDWPVAEKTVLALGLLVLALALPPWPGAVVVLAVASLCARASGLGWREWVRLLAPPMAFVVTGAVTLLVEIDGSGPSLVWAPDGPARAGAVLGQSGAAVAALLLLTASTPVAALAQGLGRLGLPAELVELALATYRFIFVLTDTMARMHASQTARLGGDGWRRRIRSAGMLAAALMPRAMARAQALEVGLAARGFDGSLRTLAAAPPLRPWRLAVILTGLAVIAAVGWGGAAWR